MWWFMVAGGVLAATIIPDLGIMAAVLTMLLALSTLRMLPSRRNTLALVLMGLPGPWSVMGAWWSTHPLWQRLIMSVALSAPWWPTPAWVAWVVVIGVHAISAVLQPTRDHARWAIPVLHLMAYHAIPVGWELVLIAFWALIGVWYAWQQRYADIWWAGAGMMVWSLTAPGVALVPWVWAVAVSASPVLTVLTLWMGMASVLAAGSVAGVLGLSVPLLRVIPQVHWHEFRLLIGVLGIWILSPNTAIIARLQPALTPFGDIQTGFWVVSASQQVVAGIPVWVVLWGGVLWWALLMQWPQERHHAE